MSASQLEVARTAEVIDLVDGVVIRLTGDLRGVEPLLSLRSALLAPRTEAARDVIVDATEVSAVSDSAVAVLWAGLVWAEQHGRRFSFSAVSEPLRVALAAAGLDGELPDLAAARLPMPGQRQPAD